LSSSRTWSSCRIVRRHRLGQELGRQGFEWRRQWSRLSPLGKRGSFVGRRGGLGSKVEVSSSISPACCDKRSGCQTSNHVGVNVVGDGRKDKRIYPPVFDNRPEFASVNETKVNGTRMNSRWLMFLFARVASTSLRHLTRGPISSPNAIRLKHLSSIPSMAYQVDQDERARCVL
jgi:hypothetical protein